MHNKGYLEIIRSYITFSFTTGVEGNIRLPDPCRTTPEKVFSSPHCNTQQSRHLSAVSVVICSQFCSFIADFSNKTTPPHPSEWDWLLSTFALAQLTASV